MLIIQDARCAYTLDEHNVFSSHLSFILSFVNNVNNKVALATYKKIKTDMSEVDGLANHVWP